MVLMRQSDPLVRGYAVTHPIGDVQLPTQRGWDQVIYATSGLFVARTEREQWIVPAHRALCIGDESLVRLTTRKPTVMRCLYLHADLDALADSIHVVTMPALTRELLLHAVEASPLDMDHPPDRALTTLLIDRLASHPAAPLHLPSPTDPRARELANAIRAVPATTLDAAIAGIAASRRTLERLFRTETAMTPAAWQRRARVLAAIELMADGGGVTDAAVSVGYATPSSFVAAFRSELGETPRAFMAVR